MATYDDSPGISSRLLDRADELLRNWAVASWSEEEIVTFSIAPICPRRAGMNGAKLLLWRGDADTVI